MLQPGENQSWDPGGLEGTVIRNDQIYFVISSAISSARGRQKDDDGSESRTELDSHANMPVIGRHAFILAESGVNGATSTVVPDSADRKSVV